MESPANPVRFRTPNILRLARLTETLWMSFQIFQLCALAAA